jgi:hypothetical protein
MKKRIQRPVRWIIWDLNDDYKESRRPVIYRVWTGKTMPPLRRDKNED